MCSSSSVVGDDLVDESVSERLVGGQDPLAHEEVHRLREADQLDDERVSAFVRLEGEAQRRRTEARARCGDAEVAREREGEAGLDRHAVDRGDRELVEMTDGEVQLLGDRSQARVRPHADATSHGMLRASLSRSSQSRRASRHVVAGAEGTSRAGDDDDADRVVHLRAQEELGHVALHRRGLPVQVIGIVHRDEAMPDRASRPRSRGSYRRDP